MTAATLLAIALMSGGTSDPCGCGAEGKPLRPRGIVGRHACDGGKCFSCQRPLWGPSAPPFDYRLIYNYPWSQKPCCAAHHQPVPHAVEEIGEPVPAPLPEPPTEAGAASVQQGSRRSLLSRLRSAPSLSR